MNGLVVLTVYFFGISASYLIMRKFPPHHRSKDMFDDIGMLIMIPLLWPLVIWWAIPHVIWKYFEKKKDEKN